MPRAKQRRGKGDHAPLIKGDLPGTARSASRVNFLPHTQRPLFNIQTLHGTRRSSALHSHRLGSAIMVTNVSLRTASKIFV